MEGRTSSWGPIEVIKKYAHGNILDVGCGCGRHLLKLRGYGNLYGVDVTNQVIQNLSEKYNDIRFFKSGAEEMIFEDCYFNLVYSIEVVEHLKDPELMFKEVKRVLKSNGVFIFQTPNYPIKRLYDLLFFLIGRSKTFADDPTHITKKSFFWWKSLAEKYFVLDNSYARNIIMDGRFPGLKK